MKASEASKCITLALAALPQQSAKLDDKAVEQTARSWAWLMPDLDANIVGAAVKRHLATSDWLPTPAQIRRIVHEAKCGRVRAGGDAWGDVLKAVSRFGINRTPEFDDPITAAAVKRFGWRALCLSENQIADRARFIELYDTLAGAAAEDESVAELPGVARPRLPDGGASGAPALVAAVLHALPKPEKPDA